MTTRRYSYGIRIAGCLIALTTAAHSQNESWQRTALEKARAFHHGSMPSECEPDSIPEALSQEVSYPLWIGEESASREALLVQFPCRIGAYNNSSVFILSDQYGTVSPVFFPSPHIEVRYVEGTEQGAVETIRITSTVDSREVVNARYDSDSRTMEERNKWRGPGDAYTLTRWGYRDGKFQIMLFSADASYDGRDNPQTLVERDIW